jgi:peptidoglycan/LPS O-acetylase OafA/YrhL
VLSGFLIHLPVALQPEKVSQNGFWHTYFYRRIMRIAPVYWLACIMGLAAFTLVPVLSTPFVLQNIKLAPWNFGDLIAKLFFLDGLWPSSGTRLGNNILNVVSIEMWLYAAYPLTLFIRRNQGWRGVFILSGMFHGVAFGLWLIGVNPVYAGISFWTFYLYWVIGAFMAEKYARAKAEISPSPKWRFVVYAFCGYLAASFFLRFTGSQIIRAMLFAMTVGLLIYSLMIAEQNREPRDSYLTMILEWIAERSYSIYAVQTPVIFTGMLILSAASISNWFVERGGTLLAVVVIAWLVHKYIEKPILELTRLRGHSQPKSHR